MVVRLAAVAARTTGSSPAGRGRLECSRDRGAEDTGPRRKRAEGQVLRASFDGLNIAHRNAQLVGELLLGQAACVPKLGQAPADILKQPVGIYRAHKPTLAARPQS
jgi:hypothetical protein